MSVQNGKGDKPRSCFSQNFKKNYDEINWSYDLVCCACGSKITAKELASRPDLFTEHKDGEIEHKNCNFN